MTINHIYDLGGHVIAEINSSGGWDRGEVYAGGMHVATYDNGTTYFTHADWPGTERVRSTVAGGIYSTWTSYPFGEGSAAANPSPTHFTGKERDAESSLDYFGARYMNSSMGRFMSPDWSAKAEPVPYSKLDDPQTLNLYAYVRNNPVTGVDHDGHDSVLDEEFAAQAAAAGIKVPPPTPSPAQQLAQQQSDCHCSTNHHFRTQNQAATAALKAIFPTSEAQLAEYGGRIYKNSDGKTYSYTTPVTQGQNGTVDPDAGMGLGNRLPAGTTSAGEYHTHPDTLAHCCAQEGFSGPDGERAVNQHIPTYILAPSGTVYKLDGTHSNNYVTAPQSSWSVNGPIP